MKPTDLTKLDITIDVVRKLFRGTNIGAPNDCWLWTGIVTGKARDGSGYGYIRIGGKLIAVHRLMYHLFNGELGNLLACHRCDNKLCCNPLHLFAGTHLDNNHDMIAKGRDDQTKKANTKNMDRQN